LEKDIKKEINTKKLIRHLPNIGIGIILLSMFLVILNGLNENEKIASIARSVYQEEMYKKSAEKVPVKPPSKHRVWQVQTGFAWFWPLNPDGTVGTMTNPVIGSCWEIVCEVPKGMLPSSIPRIEATFFKVRDLSKPSILGIVRDEWGGKEISDFSATDKNATLATAPTKVKVITSDGQEYTILVSGYIDAVSSSDILATYGCFLSGAGQLYYKPAIGWILANPSDFGPDENLKQDASKTSVRIVK